MQISNVAKDKRTSLFDQSIIDEEKSLMPLTTGLMAAKNVSEVR